jgi:hypothetical protein
MGNDEVCIRNFSSRTEALMAKGLLDTLGIASRIVGDDAGGVMPHLSFSNGVELRVRSFDARRALEVLEEVEGSSD